MTSFDFLPDRYREQKTNRKAEVWRLFVLLAFGGLCAATAAGQYLLRFSTLKQLAAAELQYSDAQARSKQFGDLQRQWKELRAAAELYTYLDHHWPRTQILAAVAEALPPEIHLSEISIAREVPPPPSISLRAAYPTRNANKETATAADSSPAALRDFTRLRDENAASDVIVRISGFTTDTDALHRYLSQLGSGRHFAKSELRSLESAGSPLLGPATQFNLRLVVRAGYGQAGGPSGANAPATKPGHRSTHRDQDLLQ
jgi:hypothetical protein